MSKPALEFPLPTCGKVHCDDARSIAVVTNDRVEIDDSLLDIFSTTALVIPEWSPKASFTKYVDLSRVIIDIETLRLDPALYSIQDKARANRIMAIGVRNERGATRYIRFDSEIEMMKTLFNLLEEKQPDLIIGHNSMWFDLPFIVERCNVLGIKCPFSINYDRTPANFAAAVICGRPYNQTFYPVYTKLLSGKKVSHIDTYMLAIAHDAVIRKFTSYTLKSLPIQLGLRDTERLDLGIEGIEDCYERQDWDLLQVYLDLDLEDTALLADRFVPAVVNQQTYFPNFTIQQLATAGNGTKWNSAMSEDYSEDYVNGLPDPIPLSFQGGLTFARFTFAHDVVFYDFSGQYPSCMLQYGLCSDRDPKLAMLSRVRHAVAARSAFKYMENPTRQDKEFVATVKPVINSAYGGLAAQIPFGDPIGAALVTAFARARLNWSRKFIEAMGATLVLSDTDSLGFITDREDIHIRYPLSDKLMAALPADASPRLLSALAIGELLKQYIPDQSALDLDSINKMVFIPPKHSPTEFNKSYRFGTTNARKLITKYLGDDPAIFDWIRTHCQHEPVRFTRLVQIAQVFAIDFPSTEGMKKNYCMVQLDKRAWKLVAKGRFVKRQTIDLDKEFQQEYMRLYAESPEAAEDYYTELLNSIASSSYPVAKLTVSRKIGISDKKLRAQGFGATHDQISYYMGELGSYVREGRYHVSYYLNKLKTMHSDMSDCLVDARMMSHAISQLTDTNQLSLELAVV